MISERKIRLMTRAAMINERDKKGIFISKKFRYTDFVIFQVAKSVIVITVAYGLFLLVLFLLNMEVIAESGSVNGLMVVLVVSIILFFVLLAVTIILTIHSCKDAYEFSRDELREYKTIMKKLEKEDESLEKVFM